MAAADAFVLHDESRYERAGMLNRNKIFTAQGPLLLTVPVAHEDLRAERLLREIRVVDDGWPRRHWKAIQFAYKRAPFFELMRTSSFRTTAGVTRRSRRLASRSSTTQPVRSDSCRSRARPTLTREEAPHRPCRRRPKRASPLLHAIRRRRRTARSCPSGDSTSARASHPALGVTCGNSVRSGLPVAPYDLRPR